MIFLRQGTAKTILVGPFLDEVDGVTPLTSLTIAAADVRLFKEGGVGFVDKAEASSLTHTERGYYLCNFGIVDTDTLGGIQIALNVSGALPVWIDGQVLPAGVYDALILGTSQLDTNVATIEDVAATDQIRDAVVADATRINAADVNTLASHDPGEALSAASDVAAAAADITDIQTQIGVAGAGLTDLPWNFDPGSDEVIVGTNNDKIGYALSDVGIAAIIDDPIEGTLTLRQLLRILLAVLAGKSTGGGTTELKYRNVADTKDRVTAVVDTSKNRTTITLDGE